MVLIWLYVIQTVERAQPVPAAQDEGQTRDRSNDADNGIYLCFVMFRFSHHGQYRIKYLFDFIIICKSKNIYYCFDPLMFLTAEIVAIVFNSFVIYNINCAVWTLIFFSIFILFNRI